MQRKRSICLLVALCGYCGLSAGRANAYFPPNIYNPYPPTVIAPVPIIEPPVVVPPVVEPPVLIIDPPVVILPPIIIIIIPPVLIIDPPIDPKPDPVDPKPIPETPEPSTVALGLIGALGIAGYKWKKCKVAPETCPV